ncbi:TrmB family transcriptional regulator [Candidatus Woesearchaeota archaeon]|nr:TrmB family transcriptional regulator [Candidatus Woesearchaeota archaeon]
MQQEKQFLQDLKKYFRLNIYEVKIWTALLSRGIASAGELADISGVPRSRCYDVLESLEKKGFIIMKIGKPIKYLAVSPEVILDRVKKNIKEEADELVMQFESVKETDEFKELELLHKTGVQHVDISSISKSIVGRTDINRFMKNMLSKAKSSVVVVAASEHVERTAKLLKGFAAGFAKKGVKVRFYSPFNKAAMKKLQNVEHVEYNASTSFVNVDGKEMAFMVSNANVAPDFEVAIWISSPFFVNAVNVLFEESLK